MTASRTSYVAGQKLVRIPRIADHDLLPARELCGSLVSQAQCLGTRAGPVDNDLGLAVLTVLTCCTAAECTGTPAQGGFFTRQGQA